MKKKMIMSLVVGILTLATSINVFAAPKQMPDGNMFDAEYYATSNPDVASVFGTDENLLYSHYFNCGKIEGRKPYADGAVTPKFDAIYYAKNNPDVVAILGTDETMLYNHYVTCGKNEGRIPCENGVPFIEVAPLEVTLQPQVPTLASGGVPRAADYSTGVWHQMEGYSFFIGDWTRPSGAAGVAIHLNDGSTKWAWVNYSDSLNIALNDFLRANRCSCTEVTHGGIKPLWDEATKSYYYP